MTVLEIFERDHHRCLDCGSDQQLTVHCCMGSEYADPPAHFLMTLCGTCDVLRTVEERLARRNLAMCFTTAKDAPRCLAEALQEVAQAKTAGRKVCIKVEVLVAE